MKKYFYKVNYGTGSDSSRSHWMFGTYENKKQILRDTDGKAFEILTEKQLFEKYDKFEIHKIVRNILVYQPDSINQFPVGILELLQ